MLQHLFGEHSLIHSVVFSHTSQR